MALARSIEEALEMALRKEIRVLQIGGIENPIKDEGLKMLQGALGENNSLHTLNLWDNQLSDQGMESLAAALEKNNSLQKLMLDHNNIGDQGAEHLGRYLAHSPSLQILNLKNNKISGEGIKFLAKALEANSSLHVLNLWGNDIADEGVELLAEALEKNQTLRVLYLTATNISEFGAERLSQAVMKNRALQKIDLSRNAGKLSESAKKKLASNREAYEGNKDRIMSALGMEWAGEIGFFPHSFEDVSHLTQLSLPHCCLQALPPLIAKFHGLVSLDLSNNQLEELPEEALKSLKELKQISLFGNDLKAAPAFLPEDVRVVM